MNKEVRCTECIHYISNRHYCPLREGKRVYQNASPRTCPVYVADERKVFIPDHWQQKPEATGTRWQVAVNGCKQMKYYIVQFPKVVSFIEAQKEAARHWEAFYLRLG